MTHIYQAGCRLELTTWLASSHPLFFLYSTPDSCSLFRNRVLQSKVLMIYYCNHQGARRYGRPDDVSKSSLNHLNDTLITKKKEGLIIIIIIILIIIHGEA